MGMMHWQAAQIAGPWRGWTRGRDLGPMGDAAADTVWALTLILEACTVTDTADERFEQLAATITLARDHLTAAQQHLHGITDAAATLAADLFPEFDW
jgi:hypothetical protein